MIYWSAIDADIEGGKMFEGSGSEYMTDEEVMNLFNADAKV